MSKELTEQWKKGKLPDGFYYVSIPGSVCGVSILDDYELQVYKSVRDSDKIEVLAPVPSYDEYLYLKTNNDHWNKEAIRISKQAIGIVLESDELVQKLHILEKKLEIATKALERYSKDDYYSEGGGRSVNPYPHIARKALKEMEGVK